MTGARSYAEQGFFPGGSVSNQAHFGPRVTFADSIDESDRMLLFDAQTSGGLLLAVPKGKLEELLIKAAAQELALWPIGTVEQGSGVSVLDGVFEAADQPAE